jgi:hypothetical protein
MKYQDFSHPRTQIQSHAFTVYIYPQICNQKWRFLAVQGLGLAGFVCHSIQENICSTTLIKKIGRKINEKHQLVSGQTNDWLWI